jgi:hypothetical protein
VYDVIPGRRDAVEAVLRIGVYRSEYSVTEVA